MIKNSADEWVMSGEPITIRETTIKHLLGLVTIHYIVEDRRPDISHYEGKYKHRLTITIVGKRYGWRWHLDYDHYTIMPFTD